MAIDRIIKQKNPKLFDAVIVQAQDILARELPWLNHVFGKAERLVKEIEGVKHYTPNIYLGGGEYVGLLPDATLGNFSFFLMDDPDTVEWSRGSANHLQKTFSLVVWCDLRTVLDDDSRNREAVKQQILQCLNGRMVLRHGHLVCTGIYERAENIYQGFTTDEVDNQYLMSPYCGFRFEGQMITIDECII